MLNVADNPVLWLTWRVHLIKRWFTIHRAACTYLFGWEVSRKRLGHSAQIEFVGLRFWKRYITQQQYTKDSEFNLRFRVP